MLRRLFILASALSLLLGAATVVLWAGSYYRTQSIRHSGPRAEWVCILDRGLVELEIYSGDTGERGTAWNDFDREAGWGREELDMLCASEHPLRTRLGFGTLKYSRWIGPLFFGRSVPGRAVFVPIWALLALALAFPTLRAWKALRNPRALRRGYCPSCGYNLRATPDRCPECGRIVPVGDRLTHNERAILELLLRDSLECGKVYHFDPGWIAKTLDLHDLEMEAAARRLAALGLVSIHEFQSELTDIVVTANAAAFLLGSTSSTRAALQG